MSEISKLKIVAYKDTSSSQKIGEFVLQSKIKMLEYKEKRFEQ